MVRGLRRPSGVGRLVVCTLLVVVVAGCTRAHYRRQADRDVYGLIDAGSTDPRWALDGFTIEPDPRSRLFDPYAPDCPPMPPDDPTSHQLMHFVDGKRGWPYEHHYGRTGYVENPGWEAYLEGYLPRGADGAIVLDREAAVLAALLHSREYQQELEDLYLSALDVTFERFRFDTQFFGGNTTSFSTEGPLSGKAKPSSKLSTATKPEVKRLFATGGQLVVDVANSVVWQFAGADGYTAITPLNFSLVQPLLRGAGRAVVLEELTDSERALLGNIRQLERFRRGFYLQIVNGRTPGPGPSRGGIGLGGVAPGGGGSVGGYLALLEQQLQIRNQQTNVASLSRSLERLDEYLRTDRITPVQVEQIRQSLYSSQINLITRGTDYEDQLDTYKITLGLPPQLDVKIEEPLVRPLELIDPGLMATQNEVAKMLDPVREMAATAVNAYEAAKVAPEADQAAQAAQALAQAGEEAADALQAAEAGDYAAAAVAASAAVRSAQAALAAAQAAGADDLVKAIRDVPQAADEAAKTAETADQAVQAGQAADRGKVVQAGANAAVQVVEAIARASAQAAAGTARVAGQGARAAMATGTAQAAEDAVDAAMDANAALRRAQLGFYEDATRAIEDADNEARQAATTATMAARDGEPSQYTKAVAEAAKTALATTQTVRLAATAENTAQGAAGAAEAAAGLQEAAQALDEAAQAAQAGDFAELMEAAGRATEAADKTNKAANAVLQAAEAVGLLQAVTSEAQKAGDLAQAMQAAMQAAQAAAEVAVAAHEAMSVAEEGDRAKTADAATKAAAAAKASTAAAQVVAQAAAELTTQAVQAAVAATGAAQEAAGAAQAAAQAAGEAALAAQAEVLPDKASQILKAAVESLQDGKQQATILDRTEGYLGPAQEDRERLNRALEKRHQQLQRLAGREEFGRGEVDPRICDSDALDQRVEELNNNIDRLANDLPDTSKQLRQFCQEARQRQAEAGSDLAAWRDLLVGLRELLDRLWGQLLELSLAKARARLDALTLTPVELQADEALEIASAYRRDWMNARAALVDQWRQIEVVAKDLESDLDLTFSGDLTTRSDTLGGVHNTTGNVQVGLAFDAPLTRLAERNDYRRALITYQQARRQYYAFEDRISQVLRETLRSIHLAPLEFELQRAAVHTAITRTGRQQELLERGRASGPTAARDLNDAFGALLSAQNALLKIWLQYEIQRMSLDFDLGVMPLDERGMWPLDDQGMWIHSEFVEGERSTRPEVPDEPPQELEILPLPELIRPVGGEEPLDPQDVRDIPRVHDADRPRRIVLRNSGVSS